MSSRQTALAGAIFVPAFLLGLFLADEPDPSTSPAGLAAWYGVRAHRLHLLAAAAMLCVAALAWVVFVNGLRERVVTSETAGRIASAASIMTGSLLAVAGTLYAAVPAGMTFGGAPEPGPDAARFLSMGSYLAVGLFAMPAVSLTLVAIAVSAQRSRALPTGLTWAGILAAAVLLGSVEFFPMLALVLWVSATCIVLARRPLRIPLPTTA
jgi:hypothetical protein